MSAESTHDEAEWSVEVVDPDSSEAVAAVAAYVEELAALFEVRVHGSGQEEVNGDLRPPRGVFVLVRSVGQVVGCGGVRRLDDRTAEVKRMWLAPAGRGRGWGRRLLSALEDQAAALGCDRVRLDTSDRLESAVATYRRSGYRDIPPYNDNPEARLWFEKDLLPPVPA